jgi:hypothetical protein
LAGYNSRKTLLVRTRNQISDRDRKRLAEAAVALQQPLAGGRLDLRQLGAPLSGKQKVRPVFGISSLFYLKCVKWVYGLTNMPGFLMWTIPYSVS